MAIDDVLLAEENASYDKAAKRFLSMKTLLAWLLKYLVSEFKDFSIRDIAEKCIEGDPTMTIDTIPVDSDFTNVAKRQQPNKIKGDKNEDGSTTEGTVFFDILFRAVVPTTGELITLIINIEPQRALYPGYILVRRAIYYACRLISSQKETEFIGDDFNKLKKVYSIWLVMDAPKDGSNSIRQYALKEKLVHGHGHEKINNYDLLTVVMVYLGKKHTKHRLLNLLHLIFLDKLKAADKRKILKTDYGMTLTPEMEEELNTMSSLALGIADRARMEGERKGVRQGRFSAMLQNVKALMENMNISSTKAMDFLSLAPADRKLVLANL
ncbi:MAG: nuclease [Selenomonadaceae bacterium]|nr:nuclease [Selenomonadaceae bacterium]